MAENSGDRDAKRAVEDVWAHSARFQVTSEVWDRFAAALDRPAGTVPGR